MVGPQYLKIALRCQFDNQKSSGLSDGVPPAPTKRRRGFTLDAAASHNHETAYSRSFAAFTMAAAVMPSCSLVFLREGRNSGNGVTDVTLCSQCSP